MKLLHTRHRWRLSALLSIGTAVAAFAAPALAGQYRLVQYPNAGYGGIHAQTAAAMRSIDMEMYELSDPTEEHDLAAAVRRGVKVRVLLDSAYAGRRANASAYQYLRSHGVAVRWDPRGTIYHIKTTVFDDTTADISSANLTQRYYPTSRDAEIVDTNPTQVAAIVHTFNADWNDTSGPARAAQAPGLVWSPGAQPAMVQQIEAARRSVYFESEELSDRAVYDALAADAHRGVQCEIVMNASRRWARAFRAVTAAGCHVHVFPSSRNGLYIHEKVILDDAGTPAARMLLGSTNASYYSLDRNRELSIELTATEAPRAIEAATDTFAHDYAHSTAWTPTATHRRYRRHHSYARRWRKW
ncbi:MAG TPA: phospholipase D-like domain-containing protein [Nevskiaceae bacterium]|nr:phospholipase D-like domain-containing protein [Nevskiaceae bacterium]